MASGELSLSGARAVGEPSVGSRAGPPGRRHRRALIELPTLPIAGGARRRFRGFHAFESQRGTSSTLTSIDTPGERPASATLSHRSMGLLLSGVGWLAGWRRTRVFLSPAAAEGTGWLGIRWSCDGFFAHFLPGGTLASVHANARPFWAQRCTRGGNALPVSRRSSLRASRPKPSRGSTTAGWLRSLLHHRRAPIEKRDISTRAITGSAPATIQRSSPAGNVRRLAAGLPFLCRRQLQPPLLQHRRVRTEGPVREHYESGWRGLPRLSSTPSGGLSTSVTRPWNNRTDLNHR